MLKKTPLIVFFLVVSLAAFAIYQYFKIPEGVTPQSNQDETVAWLAFWTSIVSLIIAILGVIEKIIGLRKRND